MGIYTEAVQKLYVAFFSRPADFGGLAHWEKVVTAANGSTAAVAAAFAASKEYQDTYAGKSNFQIINTIYNNLFSRDAEPAALLYWGDALNNRLVTIDNAVTTIAAAAQNADKTAYANKVAAATAFSAALDTTPEILGYSGTKANDAAKTWLSTVSTDASLTAAIAPAALATTVSTVSATGLAETGTTQNLTLSIDTLTGTAGNDTFVGLVNDPAGSDDFTTLTSLDTINGGTGADTLVINALTDIAGAPTVKLNSIEAVTFRAAKSVDADISAWTGVEQLTISEAVGNVKLGASATTNINANLTANGTATTIVNGGKDVVVKVSGNNAAAQTITVGTTTAAKGTVTVESVGPAAVASATPVDMGDITVKGGTTINVTQTAASSTAGLTVGTVTHNQGDIAITGDASTSTVNVKQSAYAVAVAGVAAVAEVTEVASVKFTALTSGQTLTVAGLTFTAAKDLTAAQVAAAFSNLIQGSLPVAGDTQGSGIAANGTYTGSFTGWTSAAANGDTVVFTAAEGGVMTDLAFTGTGAAAATVTTSTQGVDEAGETAAAGITAGKVTVADSGTGSIKTITIDSYGAGSTVTGSAVLETLNLSNSLSGITVADSAATLSLNLNKIGTAAVSGAAAISQTDAAITITTAPTTLNIKSTGANYIDLSAAGTETLNVSGTGTLKADVVDLSGLKTVVVTETAGLNTGATTLAATSVNTTGTTGSVTVAIDGTKATYTGGAGVDSVTVNGAAAIAKSVTLGAGNDRLVLSNLNAATLTGTDAAAALEGGEGTDTIVFAAAAAATLSATAGFDAKFGGFERVEIGTMTGNTTVNLDNLDDINYVISKGNVAAPTVTPTKTEGVAGVTESNVVTFGTLATGETFTVAGLTATATGAATAAQVAAAIAAGVGTTGPVDVTGTLANYTTGAASGSNVTFTSTTANSDVADLTVGGTGTGSTVANTPGSAGTVESNVIVFGALANGQSLTVAGRTVTAAGAATATEVATAFISGASAGNLTVSGALAGWTVADNGATATNDAKFTSTAAAGNVTDIVVSGTGATGSTLTLDKMLSNATVQMDAAGNVEVKLADATGTADVVNLITNAGNNVNIGTATVKGVETVNITANDTVSGSGVSTNTLALAADAATTVKLSGAGNLTLTLDATTKAVTSIDGSAATGKLVLASSAAADAAAVTITGGAAADVLTATSNKADVLNGGAGADTLVSGLGLATLTGGAGNDLFKVGVASANVNSYATVTDFAAGDLVQFVGATSFTSARVTLGETAVFQDYANAAINALAVGQIGWFTFGGNTYVVADMVDQATAGFVNGQDFIVKLTGTVDLTNASFNTQYGTIGLI